MEQNIKVTSNKVTSMGKVSCIGMITHISAEVLFLITFMDMAATSGQTVLSSQQNGLTTQSLNQIIFVNLVIS